MVIPCLFFRSFFLLFFTDLNIYGAFFASGARRKKGEEIEPRSLTHALCGIAKSPKKRHPPLLRHFFIPAIFFRSEKEGKCSVRRDLHIGTGKQERSLSLSSSTLTEGRKKVDKPRRIELPSSYTPPPKKSFFEKYPPPCVSHIRTTKGRIIGLN